MQHHPSYGLEIKLKVISKIKENLTNTYEIIKKIGNKIAKKKYCEVV
jgi:hypothetical protein